MKSLTVALALVCLATMPITASAEPEELVNEQALFAFPTVEGVAWVDFFQSVVVTRNGAPAQPVWDGGGSELAAVSGRRLVIGAADVLWSFPEGSWTPRQTQIESWVTAVGASPQTALAFAEDSTVWRLEQDGSWSRHDSGIPEAVFSLAYQRGIWVAGGSTRGVEMSEDDYEEEPRYGGRSTPLWEQEQREPKMWWSTDGLTWQPGSLPESGFDKIVAVAGAKGRWLAASTGGKVFGSKDGKTWTQEGLVENPAQRERTSLFALGDEFLLRYETAPWLRSADGREWSLVPLVDGAAVDVPFMKDGQIYAVGRRKEDRRLEVALLGEFGQPAPPSPAELAAAAAAAEQMRLAAEAKVAAEEARVAAEALAVKQRAEAEALAVRAKAEAEALAAQKAKQEEAARTQAWAALLDGWAQDLARWDVAMTQARNVEARRKLAWDLFAKWKSAHPGHTLDEAAIFLGAVYERITSYEINDKVMFDTFMEVADIDPRMANAMLKVMPGDYGERIKKLVKDPVNAYLAKQKGEPPPVVPPRFNALNTPPKPMRYDAPFDVAVVRGQAARGDAAAAYDLGLLYRYGQGVPLDLVASLYWIKLSGRTGLEVEKVDKSDEPAATEAWRRVAEQGSRMGRYNYAVRLRDGVGAPMDDVAALEQFKLAAEAGHFGAMVQVGQIYRLGRGVEIDLKVSCQFLERAAGQNHPLGLAELGWAYEAEAGVPRDLTKAAELYRRAGEAGNGWAMGRYAAFLLAGHGVARNEPEGRIWMERAAAKGEVSARRAVEAMAAGTYEPVSVLTYARPVKSRPMFDLAKRQEEAQSGDAAACYDMAYSYWNGVGVFKDAEVGNRWLARAKLAGWTVLDQWAPGAEAQASWQTYADRGSIVAMEQLVTASVPPTAEQLVAIRRAAEAGGAQSQRILGAFYQEGSGLPVDLAAAHEWLQRAAEIGDLRAQSRLAFTYGEGKGVPRDDAKAVYWYTQVAENGSFNAIANMAHLLMESPQLTPDPTEAASWYLKLAGLPGEKVTAAEAASRVRVRAEAGDVGVFGAWAVMLRRGFGVPADAESAFGYGFLALELDTEGYPLSWHETASFRRAPAWRKTAQLMAREYAYNQGLMAEDAAYAAKLATGEIPTFEGILARARPEASKALPLLRAMEDGSLNARMVGPTVDFLEPFKLTGLTGLMARADLRPELAGQPWLLRLASVSEKAADADEVEKLFRRALLIPAGDEVGIARLQLLRRIAAARLYYGIGREVDRPAALAWALLSVTDADSLFAVELLNRELSPTGIDSAEGLYQSIEARLKVAKP